MKGLFLICFILTVSVSYGMVWKHDLYFVQKQKKIELENNENPLAEFVNKLTEIAATFTENKGFGKDFVSSPLKQKHVSAYMSEIHATSTKISAIFNPHNILIKVELGQPKQEFYVSPNTIYDDFWVIDSECITYGCMGYNNRRQFHKHNSTTFTQYEDQLFTYMFYAHKASDILQIGNISTKVTFPLLYSVTNRLEHFLPDGLLGLSNIPLSSTGLTSPLKYLSNYFDEKVFTFAFNPLANVSSSELTDVGDLTFGKLDTVNCKNSWNYVSLSQQEEWANYYLFRVNGFRVNNIENHRRKYAIILNNFPFIITPVISAMILAEQVGAEKDPRGFFTINCDRTDLPIIHLKINDFELSVKPEEYVMNINDILYLGENTCLFAFFSAMQVDYAPSWFIGSRFIYDNYCVAYDFGNKRLGFSEKIMPQ